MLPRGSESVSAWREHTSCCAALRGARAPLSAWRTVLVAGQWRELDLNEAFACSNGGLQRATGIRHQDAVRRRLVRLATCAGVGGGADALRPGGGVRRDSATLQCTLRRKESIGCSERHRGRLRRHGRSCASFGGSMALSDSYDQRTTLSSKAPGALLGEPATRPVSTAPLVG